MMLRKVTEKLFRIVSEHEGMDDPDCSLKLEEVTIDSLFRELEPYILLGIGYIRIDPQQGLTKEGIAYLKKLGWVHPSTVKSRNEKKELEQKFWLMDQDGDGYAWSRPMFSELDLDDVPHDRIEQLAAGAEIVQKVTLKSVLSPKAWQQVNTVIKSRQAAAQKKKESAAKRAAKKKQQEIEQAKKLLQEAGELP